MSRGAETWTAAACSARYPQITVSRFHVLKGQQEIARGKQRAAPGWGRSPTAALKVRDGAGCTGRLILPAPSRPCRAPNTGLMDPGRRKALPRAISLRPVGA